MTAFAIRRSARGGTGTLPGWLAVEVKLGSMDAIDEAADTLNRVCEKVDYDLTGPPARKVVITASGYGYDRPDGVAVAPLTALTV